MISLPLASGALRAGVLDSRTRKTVAQAQGHLRDASQPEALPDFPDEIATIAPMAMRSHRRHDVGRDRERILVDHADALLDEAEHATVREPRDAGAALLALTQERFADPSDALMALRTLRKRVSLAGYEQAFEQAEQQLARLVPRRTLLSGANAALVARAHAPEFVSANGVRATDLRAFYRHFVEVCPDALETYADWIIAFSPVHRTALIEFTRDALAADVDAADPSCTDDEFMPLVDALRVLVRLRSADLAFVGHLRGAARQIGWPGGADEPDLDTPFVRMLIDGLSGASDARALIDWMIEAGCDVQPARSRAVMVQALIAGFAQVPDELYEPATDRGTLLDGLRAELTALAIDERLLQRRALTLRYL